MEKPLRLASTKYRSAPWLETRVTRGHFARMGFCLFIVPGFYAAMRCQNCNLFQPKDAYSSLFSARSDPGVDLMRKLLNLSVLRRLSRARWLAVH
jgi:hypothetical protein